MTGSTLTEMAMIGVTGDLFNAELGPILLILNLAVLCIAALSAYYAYKLYTTVPTESLKSGVRKLFLAVTTLSVTVVAVVTAPYTQGTVLIETFEFLALSSIIASSSFFLLLSFDVREGIL